MLTTRGSVPAGESTIPSGSFHASVPCGLTRCARTSDAGPVPSAHTTTAVESGRLGPQPASDGEESKPRPAVRTTISASGQVTSPPPRTRIAIRSLAASRFTQAWANATRQPHPGQPRQIPVWNRLHATAAGTAPAVAPAGSDPPPPGRRPASTAAKSQQATGPAWLNQETRLEKAPSVPGESENWSPGAMHNGAPAA